MFSKEIKIPEAIMVEINNKKIVVSGKNGRFEKEFVFKEDMMIEKKDDKIVVSSEYERKEIRALIGSIIAHIGNIFKGVPECFTYKLRAGYSHFPITIKVENGKVLIQNFLGERTPRVAKIIGNTDVKVDKSDLIVTGNNLEDVGQTAANIEQSCRIVGYDKKRFQDGVYIIQKPK